MPDDSSLDAADVKLAKALGLKCTGWVEVFYTMHAGAVLVSGQKYLDGASVLSKIPSALDDWRLMISSLYPDMEQ